MLDYVIETFYPEIQQSHSDPVERNTAFFREVCLMLLYLTNIHRVGEIVNALARLQCAY